MRSIPEWRDHPGDTWDEPHFKPAAESMLWKRRLHGHPTNLWFLNTRLPLVDRPGKGWRGSTDTRPVGGTNDW